MTSVILFVSGTLVGSFLNVVGSRWNSGLSLGGRSRCGACGRKLGPFELLPIVSFFFLRRRCRSCRARISWQYPLIELWTGLIFATVPLLFLLVFCIYVVIAIYDLRHKIIPDPLVYLAVVLSLFIGFHLAAGLVLFGFFGILWLVTSGRAIGFGDAKLALSIGLLLGAAQGFSAVILGFWIGAAAGIFLLIKRNDITIKSELPFAPFLILGAWLAVILQADLLYVSSLFP